ncbi:MAG: STAS domain-containing protein [Thiomicrorhabdus sp.]|jgi:anti-anti-sigma regulatory factor|nr:STAS domain-containing protein [Thiomicrorhabdus sp.]
MSNEIKLPENLTIHHIETHFNELNKLFNDSSDEISLDASSVDTIDTAGLQTLLILVTNAVENGKVISWLNPSEIIKTSAEKLGLMQELQLT